jgi:hypothetical protein
LKEAIIASDVTDHGLVSFSSEIMKCITVDSNERVGLFVVFPAVLQFCPNVSKESRTLYLKCTMFSLPDRD